MWINSQYGTLFNLDTCKRIYPSNTKGNISIMIEVDNYSSTLIKVETTEEAEVALGYISKALESNMKLLDMSNVLTQIRGKN